MAWVERFFANHNSQAIEPSSSVMRYPFVPSADRTASGTAESLRVSRGETTPVCATARVEAMKHRARTKERADRYKLSLRIGSLQDTDRGGTELAAALNHQCAALLRRVQMIELLNKMIDPRSPVVVIARFFSCHSQKGRCFQGVRLPIKKVTDFLLEAVRFVVRFFIVKRHIRLHDRDAIAELRTKGSGKWGNSRVPFTQLRQASRSATLELLQIQQQRVWCVAYLANVPTKALRLPCKSHEVSSPGPRYESVSATAGIECAISVSGG